VTPVTKTRGFFEPVIVGDMKNNEHSFQEQNK